MQCLSIISFFTVLSSETYESPFAGCSFMVREGIVNLLHKCFMITMIFIQKDVVLDLRIIFRVKSWLERFSQQVYISLEDFCPTFPRAK